MISGCESGVVVQRDTEEAQTTSQDLAGPLTQREWQRVEQWRLRGSVGFDPLTDNPEHNALLAAASIFCSRALSSLVSPESREDPLLCIIPEVTRADPRVRELAHKVQARGPIINWAAVAPGRRSVYVMRLLVSTHGYPVNGAAGLVGNLTAESAVLPSRIEGSAPATPMRAPDTGGRMTDFTAEQVMNRPLGTTPRPRRPGVGLAQWTHPPRRAGLFQHEFGGRVVGAAILHNMDAQVDYLVNELATRFPGVDSVLRQSGVGLNAASDIVVEQFERPQAIIDGGAGAEQVRAARRALSQRARQLYLDAQAD